MSNPKIGELQERERYIIVLNYAIYFGIAELAKENYFPLFSNLTRQATLRPNVNTATTYQVEMLTSSVKPIGKQEEGKQVKKGLRQRPNFAERKPHLLKTNGCVIGAFWDLRARPLLLEDKPPDAKHNPV